MTPATPRESAAPAHSSRLRARLTAFRALFGLPANDLELAHAQLVALAKQIPLLFIILTVNAVALAATHARSAPPFLTLIMPAAFCLVCCDRVRYWLRVDLFTFDGVSALRLMKVIMVNVAVFGVIFTAWSLALYPYGDAFARCHVAFYMAITVISCILCLMHLRGAALLLTTIVVAPYTIFFLLTGNLVLIAMAANLLLVAGTLIFVMLRNYQNFVGRLLSQRETQRLADDNLRLANLDGLTGLPNRRRFFSQLDHVLKACEQAGTGLAVAIVDLDRFKSVNDIYGHGAGDRLLEQIGQRLNDIVTSEVFIARLGGDEFGVILKTGPDEAAIAAFGAAIWALLAEPFKVNKDSVATIGCSVGVATYPLTGRTAEELFERADYALYDGKQHHKGEMVLFSQELETRIRNSSQIEQALRSADLENELWLAFQPIVDTTTGQAVAFEALARWNSPELGLIAPNVFIPIAEHVQIINRITEILFAKTLNTLRHWPEPLRVTFNLSAHDLVSAATMATIRSMVMQSGITPERIVFEITEGALLQDFDEAAGAIAALHGLGAKIALDDFGTGFSSLGYVHRLKLDKLKIDRSFVLGVENTFTAPKIIQSIIDLCGNLGLDCVIEGVETETQLAVLLGLGARYAQGYLFSKPMRAHDIAAFLAKDFAREPLTLVSAPQRRVVAVETRVTAAVSP